MPYVPEFQTPVPIVFTPIQFPTGVKVDAADGEAGENFGYDFIPSINFYYGQGLYGVGLYSPRS